MQAGAGSLLGSLAVSATALRNRAILRATLAFLAFNAVEMASWATILVYAYGATGPESVGIVAVLQLVPSALLAPVLASIGDRLPRAPVLIGWFVAQAATLAAVGAAVLLGFPPLIVYGVSALATIALTQTRPILASLLPDLTRTPEELTASNALSSMATGLGGFLGPMGAAIVLAVADPGVTFMVSAAVLALGALVLVGIGRPIVAEPTDALRGAQDGDEEVSALRPSEILAGLREVAQDRDVAAVMALVTGQFVVFGGIEVLLVLMAIELLGIGESGASVLIAALGLGAIAGGAGAFGLAGRRRLAPWLGIASVVIGLPVVLIGVSPAARSAAVLLMVSGIGFGLMEVTGQTLLQRITPDAVRARVFGVLEGLLLIGEAIGSLLVPLVVLALGLQGAAIALGLLLPVTALLVAARFAGIDARVKLPERELHALRGVAMFAPLGPASIESLARHLVRIPVAGGTRIIKEGESGDRWYLVDAGRFAVTIAGHPRNELGPGDAFGEIALLRDVPRTATVTAVGAGVVWALERDEFLAAVTGSPGALLEAERTAAARAG